MISSIDSTLYRIGVLDKSQSKLNFQLGGRKLQNGSDDSVTYGRVLHVGDRIRTDEGIRDQINRANVLNSASDSSIKEMKNIVEFIRVELIKANTSTTNSEGLEAIAKNLKGAKQNLYDLANTNTEGQYVFAGSDASIKPFTMDDDGKVSYQGDAKLRQIAVDDGSYRNRGVNGVDLMFFTASKALKGENLNFKLGDKIIDQDGKEWILDPANNTIAKTNWDGTQTVLPVNAPTPPDDEYVLAVPDVNGNRFEARRNLFDMLDEAIQSMNGLDKLGNLVSPDNEKANYDFRRKGVEKALNDIVKSHDTMVIAHADLGTKNKTFEVSLERLNSKIINLQILDKELGNSNLTEVAANLKSLEISYAAVYSTINRTFELSLVNFVR